MTEKEKCDICNYTPRFGLIDKKNGVKICNICQLIRNHHTMDIEKIDKQDNKMKWIFNKLFRKYRWNQ